MRWAGNVALMREMRNPYKIFVRKSKGNLKETGCEVVSGLIGLRMWTSGCLL
jgi:hypothetical protein